MPHDSRHSRLVTIATNQIALVKLSASAATPARLTDDVVDP